MNRVQRILYDLLSKNPPLKDFAEAYLQRLLRLNPGRQVGSHRTEDQKFMDALGRLIVGDEVCAAVTLGDKWFISTNSTGHIKSNISIHVEQCTCQLRKDGKTTDVETIYRIEVESDNKPKKILHRTISKIFDYSQYTRLRPRQDKLHFVLTPEEHELQHYDDKFEFTIALDVLFIPPTNISNFRNHLPITGPFFITQEQQCLVRTPVDPFQLRAGATFFHMVMQGSFLTHGKHLTHYNGERRKRSTVVRNHRTRLMRLTFFWNAARWYPAFPEEHGRRQFHLSDCQPSYRTLEVFLHLLPDATYHSVMHGKPKQKRKVMMALKAYTRKLFEQCHDSLTRQGIHKNDISSDRFQKALKIWCSRKSNKINSKRANVPTELFDRNDNSAEYFQRFKQYFISCRKLNLLQQFVENLTNESNHYIYSKRGRFQKKHLTAFLKKWINNKEKQLRKNGGYPTFIQTDPTNFKLTAFLKQFLHYYLDIIRIETHVTRQGLSEDPKQQLFFQKLMDLSSYEISQAHCLYVPTIVDHLVEESHAEMRILCHWVDELKKDPTKMPYLGITQLCCPHCRAVLEGLGLDYIEGQAGKHRHYAGIHGKLYNYWELDKALQNDTFLQAMLGANAWAKYQKLTGRFTSKLGKRCEHMQTWALIVLRNIGAIDQEMMTKLGMNGSPLQAHGSNMVNEDFQTPPPFATTAFTARLPTLGLSKTTVAANGACQFAAIIRSLPNTHQYPILQTANPANALRQTAVDHIADPANRAYYQPFLADAGTGLQSHQDILYPNLDVYIEEMREEQTYGDHLTLIAIARILNIAIIVVQPTRDEQAPIDVHIIKPDPNFVVDIRQSPIIVFNGINHYDCSTLRGNLAFRQQVAPEQHFGAARGLQSIFQGYRTRKALAEAEAAKMPADTPDHSASIESKADGPSGSNYKQPLLGN